MSIKISLQKSYKRTISDDTPPPNQKENVKITPDSNFDAEAFGDIFSTLYNQIWSLANSFFRNRQKFACFLEHWPETLIAVNWQWCVGKNFSLSNLSSQLSIFLVNVLKNMQILAYFWRRNLPNFKFDCFVLRTCPRNLLNWSRRSSQKFPFSEVLAQGWCVQIVII